MGRSQLQGRWGWGWEKRLGGLTDTSRRGFGRAVKQAPSYALERQGGRNNVTCNKAIPRREVS